MHEDWSFDLRSYFTQLRWECSSVLCNQRDNIDFFSGREDVMYLNEEQKTRKASLSLFYIC